MEQTIQENVTQVKLPKNVRQIGTIDKKAVIYIEDYVVTYLNQMARKERLSFGAAALYGRTIFQKDEKYVFVSAAVFEEDRPAMQSSPSDVIENGPTKVMLSTFHENEEKYFSELVPVGIAVIHKDSVRVPDAWIRKSKVGSLLGRGAVMIDLCTEGDGAEYYFYNEEGIVLQNGHYVYYEKNDIMQSFLVEWHENAQTGLSEEPLDYVAGTCRMVMEDKKEDKAQEKTTNWVSASGLLGLIAVSAIGIVVMNHYDGISRNDESTLQTSDLSVAVGEQNPGDSDGDLTVGIQDEQIQAVNAAGQNDLQENDLTGTEVPGDDTLPSDKTDETDNPETDQTTDGSEALDTEDNPNDPAEDGEAGESTETSAGNVTLQNTPIEYTIQKGDTLYDISRRYYGNIDQVPMICDYNQIENQDNIFYGQTIILP